MARLRRDALTLTLSRGRGIVPAIAKEGAPSANRLHSIGSSAYRSACCISRRTQIMAKIIDYFFTPVSPWTYLGAPRLDAMVRKHGAELRYKPCDYGKVFPVSGRLPVGQRPKQRQAYRLVELERWRDLLGMKLNIHPKHFPVASDFAARTVAAAKQSGGDPGKLAAALLRGVWAKERDVSDRATVAAICDECVLDGNALVAAAAGGDAPG